MAVFDVPRGVLFHCIAIASLPTYFATKYNVDQKFLETTSRGWTVSLTLFWLWFVSQKSFAFFRNPLRRLPNPTPGWILGNIDFNGGKPPTDNISRVLETVKNNGLVVFWMPLFTRAQIMPTTPEALMEMLNKNNYDWEKPAQSKKFLQKTLGKGLVDAEGNEHKAMRKVVAPAFSGKHIRELVPLFYSKGLSFCDVVGREAKSSGNVVEISSQMHRVTLDIIGSAGAGEDFNTIEDDSHPLAQKYAIITSTDRKFPVLQILARIWLPDYICRNMYGTSFPAISKAQVGLHEDAAAIMQKKKQDNITKDQKDLVSIIMRSGDFPDYYLVSQLLTFLAAGHDTTASALTWTMWLLCVNPHMQDRLREECIKNLAGKDANTIDPTTFDFETMPYLTAVCSEVLRLYPTVPGTMRVAIKDTTIGDVRIPKGTTALISCWAVNRSLALWGPDANKFNPDRWIKGPNAAHGGAPSANALLTFLHGPRSCIGQAFARTEMKCVLAALMIKFKFELADPNEKVEPAGFVTIKPRNGMKLKLTELV